MDVYYNPLFNANTVKSAVEDAVKNYVQGLPFDGQYSNMGCIDAVQKVAGVEVAEMKSAAARASSQMTMTPIDARYRPSAGYMKVGTAIINLKVYDEQI